MVVVLAVVRVVAGGVGLTVVTAGVVLTGVVLTVVAEAEEALLPLVLVVSPDDGPPSDAVVPPEPVLSPDTAEEGLPAETVLPPAVLPPEVLLLLADGVVTGLAVVLAEIDADVVVLPGKAVVSIGRISTSSAGLGPRRTV